LLVIAIILCFRVHEKVKSVLGMWPLVGVSAIFMFFYVLFGILFYSNYADTIDFKILRAPTFFIIIVLLFCALYIYNRDMKRLRFGLSRKVKSGR
jgi:succinate dehydrogenase hydrophobic anchor subunit